MKRNLIFTFLMMLTATALLAQHPGSIKGRVFNDNKSETLPGANVWVEIGGQKIGASTDIDGYFTLKPLDPGPYSLHISFVGYKEKIIAGVNVNPDKITFLNEIQLSPTAITTKETEIIGQRIPLINPDNPERVDLLPADIENLPNQSQIFSILRSSSSDIQVSEDDNEIYFRGSRNGDAVFIVDGIRIPGNGNNVKVPSGSIGSMTVYSGGVPAKYGDFTGGVVVIETKSYFNWLAEKRIKEYNRKQSK